MPVRQPGGELVGALVVIGPKDRLAAREELILDALRVGVARLEPRDPPIPRTCISDLPALPRGPASR